MSVPEDRRDRAGAYLDEVLSLDPARDAAEILRLRREFLGRTRAAEGAAAARFPAPVEAEDGRPGARDAREERELRARKEAVRDETRLPILRVTELSDQALRPRSRGEKKGTLGMALLAAWILIVILRVVFGLMEAGK